MPQFSGLDVQISLDNRDVIAQKASLSITDNSKSAQSRGVPDGRLRGSVEATLSIELDSHNFNIFLEAARDAGSFREIAPFDFMAYMKKSNGLELKIEAFGCAPKLSDLLDADTGSEEALIHKVECDITSSDFVRINGIPYLSHDETAHVSS